MDTLRYRCFLLVSGNHCWWGWGCSLAADSWPSVIGRADLSHSPPTSQLMPPLGVFVSVGGFVPRVLGMLGGKGIRAALSRQTMNLWVANSLRLNRKVQKDQLQLRRPVSEIITHHVNIGRRTLDCPAVPPRITRVGTSLPGPAEPPEAITAAFAAALGNHRPTHLKAY